MKSHGNNFFVVSIFTTQNTLKTLIKRLQLDQSNDTATLAYLCKRAMKKKVIPSFQHMLVIQNTRVVINKKNSLWKRALVFSLLLINNQKIVCASAGKHVFHLMKEGAICSPIRIYISWKLDIWRPEVGIATCLDL